MKRLLTWLLAVGTLLPAAAQQITEQDKERAAALVERMTLDEKLDYIGGFNSFYIRAIPRLGIPQIRMADGPQGVRNDTRSTMFPCGIAAAAAWDRALVRDYGRALGQDCRARGVHILLGPGVNIYRSPLCGRNFEYYGEDPYLAAETAAAYIEGMQAEGVMACVKHFVGNNQEWNRHHVSSDIDERTLHEIYLPAFRKAVTGAKVGAVMSSYNPLNCVHMTENRPLTVGLLREKWGFDGIFMSDWNATYSAVGAANGGLDLEMPRARFMNAENLRPALENGLVTEATVDEKCRHILQTLIAFGFLDREQTDAKIKERNPFSDQVALEVARGGIVLLKNEGGMLPFSSKVRDVVVMGPNAGRVPTGGGAGFVHPFSTVSVGEGMRAVGKRLRTTVLDPAPVGDLAASGLFFTPDGRPGLRGEFFAGKELAGMPVATQVDAAIDFDWEGSPADGVPADGFSARWSGSFKPAATGRVTFVVRGDDGYRLYVDGREVLADWRDHAATTRSATLDVVAGKSYAVRLEYYDNASTASLSLRYLFENVTDRERRIAAADAVIYCAGFDSDTERENHDRTFALPEGQAAEIAAVAKFNANLVVVVNSGGGVDFAQVRRPGACDPHGLVSRAGGRPRSRRDSDGSGFAQRQTADLDRTARRGQSLLRQLLRERRPFAPQGGTAAARQLRRRHLRGLPRVRPYGDRTALRLRLRPFLYHFRLFGAESRAAGRRLLSGVVRREEHGRRDGAEVAQLYVSDLAASVPRPVKELKGYEKVFLKRGETKRVEILLPHDAFAFYDTVRHDFVVEPGDFLIQVGASSRDLRLKGTIRVD